MFLLKTLIRDSTITPMLEVSVNHPCPLRGNNSKYKVKKYEPLP